MHDHHHHGPYVKASAPVRRLLLVLLAPVIAFALVGLVVLWPDGRGIESEDLDLPAGFTEAEVVEIQQGKCHGAAAQEPQRNCATAVARLTSGPREGRRARFDASTGTSPLPLQPGDRIVLGVDPNAPRGQEYYFADRQRGAPMVMLAILFAIVVIALGRWKGVTSLVGLAMSLLVLIVFILPSILDGKNPLMVAAVGATLIMFVALFLSHGFNMRTTTALLGTVSSLWLTALLAFAAVHLAKLSGATSEEAIFVNISAGQIDLRGLLLGGIVIGALGVLDDVTVTQASAVWELHHANPGLGFSELYKSAVRIGRDHIASTVNTLVLAYAGASLPLFVLFTLAQSSVSRVVTGEIVAEEVIRTLVGSIGLVASVPVTTALTSYALTRSAIGAAQVRQPAED